MAQNQWLDNGVPQDEPDNIEEIGTQQASSSSPEAVAVPNQHSVPRSNAQANSAPVAPGYEIVWTHQNLLTFDGGGIRGYWSLLVMRQLMDHIFAHEMNPSNNIFLRDHDTLRQPHLHSFHPQPYPDHVSHVELSPTERRLQRVLNKVEALDPARRYLPCHYFDLIGGTSTGALIAAMLGRLRMTVLDCLNEYASLGDVIFGHPRLFGKARMLLGSGTKLKTSEAEQAYKRVVMDYSENTDEASVKFRSKKHMCNTFATATRVMDAKGVTASSHVIRSYRMPRDDTVNPRMLRQATMGATIDVDQEIQQNASVQPQVKKRVYEAPPDFDIYQVARAATAVTRFHLPQKVETFRGDTMIFEDAALLEPNPTPRGIAEINAVHGENRIGIVVSVGTAKANHVQEKEAGREGAWGAGRRLMAMMLDPDNEHEKVKVDLSAKRIPYFRLNPDKEKSGIAQHRAHRINLEMDHWEPKGSSSKEQPGSRTLLEMKTKFERWYESSQEVRDQFDDCAAWLVARRRRRAQDQAKWERYVNGSTFDCPLHPCSNDNKFIFRDKFVQHCKDKHPRANLADEQLVQIGRREGWSYQKIGSVSNYIV